jgi:Spy/CpxP family protein refolding chaperone
LLLGVLSAVLGGLVQAADDAKARERGKRGQLPGAALDLLPADLDEKLALSTEQKEKLARLREEVRARQKAVLEKLRDAMQQARQNKDRDKLREQFQAFRQEAEKLRDEVQAKLKELLSDEQKKKFEELKKSLPQAGERPFGRFGFPQRAAPGQLLPPELQERLGLTAEQKEKIAKLQQETEAKLRDVLTDEQKKKLDELKERGRPRPGQRRPGT